ncbi:hypothetical protein EYF80_028081 [Liparis tanakae]|uniref:Uncharacterized protein n=1 Tax=Liparis tanakae TaxID=230148 RepID=A0A4Z2H7E2_9TELE|nr:hypothetical protein EYF80_028081 [Liparis tanakae]
MVERSAAAGPDTSAQKEKKVKRKASALEDGSRLMLLRSSGAQRERVRVVRSVLMRPLDSSVDVDVAIRSRACRREVYRIMGCETAEQERKEVVRIRSG